MDIHKYTTVCKLIVELEQFSNTLLTCFFLKNMVENYFSARICKFSLKWPNFYFKTKGTVVGEQVDKLTCYFYLFSALAL